MIPQTAKAYMDAKSDALQADQKGWMQAYEARMDARFADFTAGMEKKFSDMTRWIVGLLLGTTALTMSFMTFLIVNVAPKLMVAPPSPAPAVSASPAPAAAPPTVVYYIYPPVIPPATPPKKP